MEGNRRHTRGSNRLPGWDYSSAGCYFVTFCTYRRKHLFGHVEMPSNLIDAPTMVLNENGVACDDAVRRVFSSRDAVAVDAHVVMPNHIHMLIRVSGQDGHAHRSVVSRTVGSVKAGASKNLHEMGFEGRVWQPGFHDHIVRDERDYERIFTYIENNPAKWMTDCFYG